MRVLVTGANGYLGQGIVKALLDKGSEVIAADFELDYIDERAIKLVGNIFENDNLIKTVGIPDVLLHLAWRDGFVHYADTHIKDLNSHYAFIKRLTEHGVARIAVMGSMHEVGFFEGSIKEDTPCNPTTPYGISKNALRCLTEMICKQRNIAFQWIRGFYIVGNSECGSSIFSKIVKAEKAGKTEFPFTMGLNQFDFIDYDDFCSMVAATVLQDKELGIINVCHGRPEKLADRVERFIIENKFNIRLQYGIFPERPYDSKAVWGDDTKIRRILRKQQ
ncbi:NAD(P)-dependent oxidoreductase [Schaedlerella arabinosiphila]|jgi:nucleoside-diphosphate-sugar epimerase|uniref:NAD(P)-dependent oxidoreductase n=1 Tax=Schaedlerella arabinosiphila TaxID=2044587 RepID=A0A3R8LG50_9FIRM|nr:NAD(P)-dependent oxidoreductase [Schaedlerella arabinosiphila]RRK32613.1 NAD(P)-dependent oxidoreductase [Schaedlerella arabinosiphila]